MNITTSHVINQMEKELNVAKDQICVGNYQRLREHVNVIRSLCDLIMEADIDQQALNQQTIGRRMMNNSTNNSTKIKAEDQTNRLLEEDANGESIFDF